MQLYSFLPEISTQKISCQFKLLQGHSIKVETGRPLNRTVVAQLLERWLINREDMGSIPMTEIFPGFPSVTPSKCWDGSTYISEQPPEFVVPAKYCLDLKQQKCDARTLIQSAWCKAKLCFYHFINSSRISAVHFYRRK